jgi:hypothetical protein
VVITLRVIVCRVGWSVMTTLAVPVISLQWKGTGTIWVDDVTLHEAIAMDPFAAWQALGMDTHSVVAEPRFVDAAKGDYRLQPDSPAITLGFKPIPVEKIGPYQDDLRASWPIVEAEGVREHPLPAARIP